MKKILITSLLLILSLLVVGCDYNVPEYSDGNTVTVSLIPNQVVPMIITYNISDDITGSLKCITEFDIENINNTIYLTEIYLEIYEDHHIRSYDMVDNQILYQIITIKPRIHVDLPWITDEMNEISRVYDVDWLCDRLRMNIPIEYKLFWNETLIKEKKENCDVYLYTNNPEFDEWSVVEDIEEQCFTFLKVEFP
jgi:hypothetical protein